MTDQPATVAGAEPGADNPGLLLAPPPPGLYDVPPATYHRWDCASNSTLCDLLDRSPLFARMRQSQPWRAPSAESVGTVAHAVILEPDAVDARFMVSDQCSASKGDKTRCSNPGMNQRAGLWYCNVKGHADQGGPAAETPDPRLLVLRPTLDLALRMRDAVWADPDARDLLQRARREVSGVWIDPDTGLPCKFRPDAWDLEGRVVTDLKTTSDGGHAEDAWARIVAYMKYYRQASWYSGGARMLAPVLKVAPPEAFCWVAVEDSEPFEVGVYECDDLTRIAGRFEMDAANLTYAECVRSGLWPSRQPGIPRIRLPEWSLKRLLPEDRSFEA